ncbi:hypothetical protein B0H13DRAFT_2309422 [Mycena leptocephala]|nr:hypothetical protein B0H13DRAFT_2309422 [Mycena leptocephala]
MLDILADLAKYDDAVPQIIHSSSGIVHELLNMLNTGAADVDRWRVGVKGLLTLNLFELPSKEEDRLVKSLLLLRRMTFLLLVCAGQKGE